VVWVLQTIVFREFEIFPVSSNIHIICFSTVEFKEERMLFEIPGFGFFLLETNPSQKPPGNEFYIGLRCSS